MVGAGCDRFTAGARLCGVRLMGGGQAKQFGIFQEPLIFGGISGSCVPVRNVCRWPSEAMRDRSSRLRVMSAKSVITRRLRIGATLRAVLN